MSILKLKSSYTALSKTEKRISDYIIECYHDVIYMSISELAKATKAGEATIIRLCKKLEYKGFHDFKLSLAKEHIDVDSHIHGENKQDYSNLNNLVHKLELDNTKAIRDTSEIINFDRIDEIVDKIIDSKKVSVFGVGASSLTAGDFYYKFLRLGINVSYITDNHLNLMSAALLDKDCVAIGISFSGCTKDTVDAVKEAHNSGAYTVALTNYMHSPITKYSSSTIITAVQETPLGSGSLVAKITQLFLLDVICSSIMIKQKNKVFSTLNSTAESVSDRLY